MSMSGFDPTNMFWKMLLNTQEMNQMALKVFLNTQISYLQSNVYSSIISIPKILSP